MTKRLNLKALVPYFGLLAIVIVFLIGSGGQLFRKSNILVIFGAMFIYTIAALGTSFVFTIGCLDFSLGSLVGVTATVGALAAQRTDNLFFCIVIAMGIGGLTGFGIAALHILFDLNPFIVSVTVMFAYRGFAWILNANGSTPLPLSMY